MADAIEAKAAIKDQGRLSDTDTGTDALIRLLSGDTSMLKCAVCGAQAGTCDCWEKCPCGWSFRKGAKCQNPAHGAAADEGERSEEHTSELQSLMRISYAVFCLQKKKTKQENRNKI